MASSHLARISLEAVIVAVTDDTPRILTVSTSQGRALPAGSLDAGADRTLELGLRRLVARQAGLDVGYVEQLYSFGDLNRDRHREATEPRLVGIAYLALTREAQPRGGATWFDWYRLFPWEDHREGRPVVLSDVIEPALRLWAREDHKRAERVQIAFGLDGTPWDGVRALERYELLYEARMVQEWAIDHARGGREAPLGEPMARDHRRVAATALARLRGKITYRPVVFELLPEAFTLTRLRRLVEALAGVRLHAQNFRRLVESQGLVEATGEIASTGGRPAGLFRFRRGVLRERPRQGVGRP